MSTGRARSLLAAVLLLSLLLPMAYGADPAELEERLDALNEAAFGIDSSRLSEESLRIFDELKRYLSDAELNMQYGSYDVAEELIENAEDRLALLQSLEGSRAPVSLPFSGRVVGAVAVVLLAAALVVFVALRLIPKMRKDESAPEPRIVQADRCPVCSGRVYNGVCVWCSYDYYKE